MTLIAGLLNQNITSISSVTEDGYGDETETELYTNVPCRWQEKVTQVVNVQGEIVQSDVEAWIKPSYTVEEDYKIVFDSSSYTVVAKAKKYSLGGDHDHTKLFLK